MDIIPVLTTLVIGGLAYWAISLIELPDPFPRVIKVVVIVALVLYLLSVLGSVV